MIGDQLNDLAVLIIPYCHSSQLLGVFLFGAHACEFDDLVLHHMLMAVFGQFVLLYHLVSDVVLVPDDKKHLVAVPDIEQEEVVVETVCYDHASL